MKIVLYTSDKPDIVNQYNIYSLIEANPTHDYYFVAVRSKQGNQGPSTMSALKFLFNRIFKGKEYWFEDNQKVFAKVSTLIERDYFREYPITLVPSVNSEVASDVISKLNPDIVLQCGAGILKPNIFEIPRIGTINVHHGYAPEVRGISSTFWAMKYKLPVGVTVHFIDKSLDTGVVICQEMTPGRHSKYSEVYFDTIMLGAKLLAKKALSLVEGLDIEEEEVESFYFSHVDERTYRDFRKQSGQKISKTDSQRSQRLIKKRIRPS